jgi:AcrR family transcriptional regulator
MYRMLRFGVPTSTSTSTSTSPARDRLLAKAVEVARQGGIADLSLREIAAAVGTSHRMLAYHFGSREGLLVAITQAVEAAELARLAGGAMSVEGAWEFWKEITDPGLSAQERLFFELYSYALLGRPGTEGFLDGIVESWVGPVAAQLVERGMDEAAARAEARLGVAVVRGLVLDLLATGDREGVDAAYRRYLERALGESPDPGEAS